MAITFAVSLSLILSTIVVSDSLNGYDIHQEFNVFLQAWGSKIWRPDIGVPYNSALSISILPLVISTVSGIGGLTIFKFILPLLFSTAPVLLYKLYRKILPPEGAFLSAFLFMSYPSFYGELIYLGRQEVAEVLLLTLLLCFFSSRKARQGPGKTIAVLLLTFGMITAHYSLAYIYLGILAFSILMSRLSDRAVGLCTPGILLLSAVISVCWYPFAASGAAFISLADFVSAVAKGAVVDLFNPISRPPMVMQALGLAPTAAGFLHFANRATQYIVVFSIILGFIIFVWKREKMLAERKMLPLMMFAFVMLCLVVLAPFFAAALNLSRTYQIVLLFLSPCFTYGVVCLESGFQAVYSFVRRHVSSVRMSRPLRKQVLAAGILLCYFLFLSGWVWSVSMEWPGSFLFDRERVIVTYPDLRVNYYDEYTVPQDIASASWLESHLSGRYSVCADLISRWHVLNSYGGLPRDGPTLPSECNFLNSYVYLGTLNTVYGIGTWWGLESTYSTWPISSISPILGAKNRVFSDGGSVIYA